MFWNKAVVRVAYTANILKTTKLYNLKRSILCYVNFNSIKKYFFKKDTEREVIIKGI